MDTRFSSTSLACIIYQKFRTIWPACDGVGAVSKGLGALARGFLDTIWDISYLRLGFSYMDRFGICSTTALALNYKRANSACGERHSVSF